MYVIARREGESIMLFGNQIEIKILSVTGKIARLGVDAPREVDIKRKETVKQTKVSGQEG